MRISNQNTNSFGQVKIAQNTQKIMTQALKRKKRNNENFFALIFSDSLQKCENTQYADLIVTKDKMVFVQDKQSGNLKKIDGHNSLLNNILNGLRHVLFAEENRLHF